MSFARATKATAAKPTNSRPSQNFDSVTVSTASTSSSAATSTSSVAAASTAALRRWAYEAVTSRYKSYATNSLQYQARLTDGSTRREASETRMRMNRDPSAFQVKNPALAAVKSRLHAFRSSEAWKETERANREKADRIRSARGQRAPMAFGKTLHA